MISQLRFFLIHLSISFFIALLMVGLVFFIWYPLPLASAVGVTQVFLMMLVIDVIVGPLLGWLVYKEGKKTLKFDLGVIIFLQLAALFFGVFSIEQGRPVWIAYNVDRFELVRKNEIITERLEQVKSQFKQPSWLQPQYVAVEFAQDKLQRENEMFAEVLGGISLAQRPERYVDFTQAIPQIKQRAKSLQELEQYNDQKLVQQILEKYPEATGYVPLKANAVDMTVLINKETGEVVKIIDLRPW
ncbi:TfpX/TfpZ family type IV pilin accessory protein [Acinetobacter sp. YH12029]|uniref:TfpX/TfpZ family type IV pilin accessory protein n=1 Tax=Acinetobacter sp. YH12029 TaxID=2601044 RepID=UPI0015D1A204|nr:TfpX/TfpZ family type IV pilin accessory protein [Acinetobacter sp. YH12029]